MTLPALPDAVLAALPATTPAPPWPCLVDAVVWWHRAAPGARSVLLPGMRPGLPLTVGALITYRESPVGPYREVLASPLLLRGGGPVRVTVPWIAVDSVASIAGGRTHWGLPKTLASFTGDTAHGEGWTVSARPRPVGPRLPVAARFSATQDGVRTARSSLRARGRFARVEVEGAGLPPWLLPGRHPGLVLTGARLVVGPAR